MWIVPCLFILFSRHHVTHQAVTLTFNSSFHNKSKCDIARLADLFNLTAVLLKERAYFCHNEEIWASAFKAWRHRIKLLQLGSVLAVVGERQALIRSRSLLKCEEGEWSRRREFQLIWWPNVYSQAKYWTFATEILSRTHCTRKLII